MTLSRRDMLKTGAMASAALIANDAIAETAQSAKSTQPIRIGVSTYSYWHFDKVKYPIEKVIENAARLGFDGVEILHRQMEGEEKKYLNNLKRMAFANGLDLFFLSIHQNFVSRQREAAAAHRPHEKMHRPGALPGLPRHPIEFGPLGHDPRFSEDAGRGRAGDPAARLH